MTIYHHIKPLQEPFDFMVDENKRIVFSSNFIATAISPVTNHEREIAKLINDAGLGTLDSDMFIGRKIPLPKEGDGPFIQILNTGGTEPDYIHNSDGPNLQNPSCQILVRGKQFELTRTRIWAIWRILNSVRNQTVVA